MKEKIKLASSPDKLHSCLILLIPLFFAVFTFGLSVNSQNIARQAQQGFDSLRANIAHGKIDTISYTSKTVGTKRRVIIWKNFYECLAGSAIFKFIYTSCR